MGFWILALLAAVVTVAIIGYALVTRREDAEAASAAYDLQVYRDQLKELDRDLARGVIGEEEAQRARVEISRRLLEADRKAQAGEATTTAPRSLGWAAVALVAAFIIGGGAWLYSDLGAPGYWDMPLKGRIEAAKEARETRMAQAEAEAGLPAWDGPPPEAPQDYIDLVEQLRAAVTKRPDDMHGQSLLVTHETALGNYVAAHQAMAKVIASKGDSTTAEDYSQYADLLVLAARGYVSPEAEDAITRALQLNPRDPVALYYSGLMFAQTGRPDLAFRLWRDLLESSDPSEPWVEPIRSQIMQLAAMAGVDYTLPPAMPGPSAEDMAAAADMTPEERAQMVDSMVNQLMERLATEGGPASDWARLISVLGVQGQTERAAEIYAEAQAVFAGRDAELEMLAAAARQAGIEADGSAPAAQPGPDAAGVTE